jgi:hypothetical protein
VSPKKAAKTTLHAFRIPDDLIGRVDTFAATLQAATPWRRITRADAVRALLVQALDAAESGAGRGIR